MLGIPPAVCASCSAIEPYYGVNGAGHVSYNAALMPQAVGKPVRVQLARQDEMAWENYGLAYVVNQRVALDAEGTEYHVGLRGLVSDAWWSGGNAPQATS